MNKVFILVMVCLLAFSSCKKEKHTSPSAGKTYADFLVNSEWVGTLDKNGYQYPPPCYMTFRSSSKLVIYAPFAIIVNGSFVYKDSLTGSVISIDSLSDGRTKVLTNIDMLNEVSLFISDRKKMSSLSTNSAKPTPFNLELFTATGYSVKETSWSGPLIPSGPGAGLYAYPDLSSINFLSDGTSVYYRNGNPVKAQPTPQLPTPGLLKVKYRQFGAMIFMSGYNETNLSIMDYFGVLTSDATKMMVHSWSVSSRLPNYIQTNPIYGIPGNTPIINRQ